MRTLAAAASLACICANAATQPATQAAAQVPRTSRTVMLESANGALRVEIERRADGAVEERVAIDEGGGRWVTALTVSGAATRVMAGAPAALQRCRAVSVEQHDAPARLVVSSECPAGRIERMLAIGDEPDAIAVRVRFTATKGVPVHAVEDRYTFAPGRRDEDTPLRGPLDFVWSQNIKREKDDLIPQWGFKSPVVMFQQDRVFAALLPRLSDTLDVPLALDLDVTSDAKPWLSYGSVPSEPHHHSYFRRKTHTPIVPRSGTIEYAYDLIAASEPPARGYQRIVRRLWRTFGRPRLLDAVDLQRNVLQHELTLFDDWRQEAWVRYADSVYRDVACSRASAGDRGCGTLTSRRHESGQWNKGVDDAWFNSWFQTLRTAYGWYLHGRQTQDREMQRRAEAVLTLALDSPQQGGVFSTIFLVPERRWIREDGWAGFRDDYHAFCMSWTAYWMLQWARDLVPERKDEILAFTRAYGDFLLTQQLPSGLIPSWFDAALKPRREFGDYNAETAGSALFLLELGELTGHQPYIEAATRAMEFITRETLPRQRWFDYETFKSCARKPFDFYDAATAQYPQNNLSTIQAAMAYLKLYRLTKAPRWLDLGTQVVDYLLLTQQVWQTPGFEPQLLGGFTTQNTDAEWSDARQCYAAVLLLEYYKDTHDPDYLERAVAAARATFAVAPWENWAHTGYRDAHGSMTGFHWGTGSAMTSVEIMAAMLGDAFVDVERQHGVGFNASTIRRVRVDGDTIAVDVEALPALRTLHLRFAGAKPDVMYALAINAGAPIAVSGAVLNRDGYTFTPQTVRPVRPAGLEDADR